MLRRMVPAVVLVAIASAATISSARADGLIRDGFGAISMGRGGTNIAHSDNGGVLLDNPAGIINAPDNGLFEIGIDTVVTVLDYRDADPNDTRAAIRPNPVPQLAYIRKSEDGMWAAGIGLYLPAGFTAEYDMVHPILGPQQYRSLGVLAKILPGVACRVTDRLSVGATLGIGISHVELEGPFIPQTPPLAGAPALFNLETTGVSPAWSLGMQYQLTDDTVIGVAYNSANKFKLKGEAEVTVVGVLPDPIFSRFDTEMELEWPSSLGFGVTHMYNCQHRFSADAVWYDWSGAFDSLDMTLTNSSNPLIPIIAGSNTLTDSLPLDWRDSVSLRFGYEYFTVIGDVWRLGYTWHRSPVPDATLNPYTDGVLEHAITAGHSRQLKRNWWLNLSYEYTFGPTRHVGVSQLVGGDFSNSDFRAQAHWVGVSLLRTF